MPWRSGPGMDGRLSRFEVLMSACIGLMFVTVLLTALLLGPDWNALAKGLFFPAIPPGGVGWTLGVMGGVGGTVTLLSYGYWIRETGRQGREGVKACRIDLAVGYTVTALFGVAMVIIGSRVALDGKGASLALILSSQLEQALGAPGKWAFLLGFGARSSPACSASGRAIPTCSRISSPCVKGSLLKPFRNRTSRDPRPTAPTWSVSLQCPRPVVGFGGGGPTHLCRPGFVLPAPGSAHASDDE